MHPHEEAIFRAFIAPERRARWLGGPASAMRRGKQLDRPNHGRDRDDRYATGLPSNTDVAALLRARGAPPTCPAPAARRPRCPRWSARRAGRSRGNIVPRESTGPAPGPGNQPRRPVSATTRATAALLLAVAATPAAADPATLAVAWEYATPGVLPQALLRDRAGRAYLHVALKTGGLATLDISGPAAAPKRVAAVGIEKLGGLDVMHLAQQKHLLYLALGDFFRATGSPAGLAVVSVADPHAPKVLGVWKSDGTLQGAAAVVVRDRYAYLGGMGHGVFVLDVADPKAVRKVAEILPDVDFPRKNPGRLQHPNARGLALQGRYLYVAFDAGGLRVIDVADPLRPREVGRYVNGGMKGKQQAYNNLVIDGTTAYVATDYAGMEVLDVRDPRDIRPVAWWNPWKADTPENLWFNSPGHTNQIEFDPKRRLVYLSAGDSELLVVDVSERTRPRLAARYGEPRDRLGAWGLTVAGDFVYLAYITAAVPFHGTWSGIKAVKR